MKPSVRVDKSDGRHYKAKCTHGDFLLNVQYNFAHIRSIDKNLNALLPGFRLMKKSQRAATAKQIAVNSASREIFL